MASSGRRVGLYINKNSRFLLNQLDQFLGHRSFTRRSGLQQQTAIQKDSTEAVVIPRKKTWGKEAVLEALASTVSRDPTAYHYQFHDDPFLSPRTSAESKLYSMAQQSGRSAAKYFVDSYPKYFTKDFAEPHIPCLMPASMSLSLEEVSEEALMERISLRKVGAAVEMYDQLVQAGTTVSMRTTSDLLDLICFYGDGEPAQEGEPETDEMDASGEELKRKKGRSPRGSDVQGRAWRKNNNAERLFHLLPERDVRCYSALVRGMVKHGAFTKAFDLYADMLNNRLTADVNIFNALILAVPHQKEGFTEKMDLITELLNHMNKQKVQPNLQTFNNVLKVLRRCGPLAKSFSLSVLNEMKALEIGIYWAKLHAIEVALCARVIECTHESERAPSLATFNHLLSIFYKSGSLANNQTSILYEVMAEIEGTSFTSQDPDDGWFFVSAMKMCMETNDMKLGYRVHSLVGVGENWRLLGDSYQQGMFYSRLFSLLCMMERIDVVLQWYQQLMPSLYYPSPQSLRDLLQALDTESRLELLPSIWKDVKTLGHDNRSNLVEELLALMAREKHSPEVQESFADCALDIKGAFDGDQRKPNLEWSAAALCHITTLLLRANRIPQAWEMMQLFKANNRIPSNVLLEDFLSQCSAAPATAVELVKLSAAFYLPATPRLAQRVLVEMELTDEQRTTMSELESSWEQNE